MTPAFVLPWLAISDMPTPSDVPALREAGITHVVDLSGRSDGITGLEHGFHAMYLPTTDPGVKSLAYWWAGIAFALGASAEGRVLVHCWAGSNRSPRMAQAILMVALSLDFESAEHIVRTARPSAAMDGYAEDVAVAVKHWRLATGMG